MMKGGYSWRLTSALLNQNGKMMQVVIFEELEVVVHQLQIHEKKDVKKSWKNPLLIQGQLRKYFRRNIIGIDCIIQRLCLLLYRLLLYLKIPRIR